MDTPLITDFRADEALALAHVRKVKGFYIHLAQYVIIMGGLTVLNYLTSPAYFWVVWPAAGWGLGVAMHGLGVFNLMPFFGPQWERRQVEKYLGREL